MYASWLALDDAAAPSDAFASVRLAVSGAAPLPDEIAASFHRRFGVVVHQGYGLTEAAPIVTTTAVDDRDPRAGSIGPPLPGVEVRLVDADGTDVLAGDPGEVWVRGPNVFPGYWHDQEATARVLTDDGWLRTGDVAVVEGDELRLVDRAKDLIIVSGFNVFPVEVEDVLRADDAVRDVAVVGEPHPRTGETVVAYVVPEPGHTVDPEELRSVCARALARYKCPSRIEVVDELPRSIAGKLVRRELREPTLRLDAQGAGLERLHALAASLGPLASLGDEEPRVDHGDPDGEADRERLVVADEALHEAAARQHERAERDEAVRGGETAAARRRRPVGACGRAANRYAGPQRAAQDDDGADAAADRRERTRERAEHVAAHRDLHARDRLHRCRQDHAGRQPGEDEEPEPRPVAPLAAEEEVDGAEREPGDVEHGAQQVEDPERPGVPARRDADRERGGGAGEHRQRDRPGREMRLVAGRPPHEGRLGEQRCHGSREEGEPDDHAERA